MSTTHGKKLIDIEDVQRAKNTVNDKYTIISSLLMI